MTMIVSGSKIGILGGGQLARMLALQASKMGYLTYVYTDVSDSPASFVATKTVVADYTDHEKLKKFILEVDIVTFEFENIPTSTLSNFESLNKFRPSLSVFKNTQNRIAEKKFLKNNNLPHLRHWLLKDVSDLVSVQDDLVFPLVFKTAFGGYDGKGQHIINSLLELKQVAERYKGFSATLEVLVDIKCEISVIVARDLSGNTKSFGPIENQHISHILDISFCPSKINQSISKQAIEVAIKAAECLELIGLICIEFFVDKSDQLFINEIAPRTHNSGHLTIEGASESQFEQQIRAICGIGLGDFSLIKPTAMANLLGDLWDNGEPNWRALENKPNLFLHLYQKNTAAKGRKMGHITAISTTTDLAIESVKAARQGLVY